MTALPNSNAAPPGSVEHAWARATTRRMQKGGDLYRRPLTRAEMTAPEAWHERGMARVHRFGELPDGTIGWERIR